MSDWRAKLKSLPGLSEEEKSALAAALISSAGTVDPEVWFDQTGWTTKQVEASLRALLASQGTQTKIIFMTDLSLEGEVLRTLRVTFSGPQSFRDYLARCWVPGLQQRQPPELEPILITEYDQLQAGFEYDDGSVPDLSRNMTVRRYERVKDSGLGQAMVRELPLAGYADSPRLAPELTTLSSCGMPDQEFDAVILDGEHSAFLGWHVVQITGMQPVWEMQQEADELLSRAANATSGPYMKLQHREIGLCFLPEEDARGMGSHYMASECQRRGVALFTKNGPDISLSNRVVHHPVPKRLFNWRRTYQRVLRRSDIMRAPVQALHTVCTVF